MAIEQVPQEKSQDRQTFHSPEGPPQGTDRLNHSRQSCPVEKCLKQYCQKELMGEPYVKDYLHDQKRRNCRPKTIGLARLDFVAQPLPDVPIRLSASKPNYVSRRLTNPEYPVDLMATSFGSASDFVPQKGGGRLPRKVTFRVPKFRVLAESSQDLSVP